MSETISPNSTITQYTIVSKIGEGGMGEVYRARDSRLDRNVAIKILPANFAADVDRLNRFEQEARATSALNHPNILTIYDIGTHDGSPYIVAELLEGEELRDRLNQSALPLRKVIDYAQQIVSGLAAAHEKGIVHRDLKPENLFITKDERVKILDFGIAKLSAPSSTKQDISEDATRKVLTNPGVVMGTVGYMSPEQVRGQAADHRSDIFSFGAILHEMITGKRAFKRETMAETMSAILKEEPEELAHSNPNVSPALERIVGRCLEKKPERRFQTASDLGFALESLTASSGVRLLDETSNAISAATVHNASSRRALLFGVLGALALSAVAAMTVWVAKPKQAPPLRVLELPASIANADRLALSPDGTRVAYILEGHLHVRGLDGSTDQDLGAIQSAAFPVFKGALFWSPDSKQIGFATENEIRTVPAGGGIVFVVGKIPGTGEVITARWFHDGNIVFAVWRESVYSIPATGGAAVVVMPIDPATEIDVHHISEAPNGRLIAQIHQRAGDRNVTVITTRGDNTSRVVLTNDQTIHAVDYVNPGLIVFARERVNVGIWVVPFSNGPIDLAKATLLQPGAEWADIADDGSMIFELPAVSKVAPVWVDKTGSLSTIGGTALVNSGGDFALSPDGKRMAIVEVDRSAAQSREPLSLLIRDLTTGIDTRLKILTTSGQPDDPNAVLAYPSWFPSGDRLLLTSGSIEAFRLLEQRADGATPPRELASGLMSGRITSDGATLAAIKDDRGRFHLMYAPVSADGTVGEARRVFQDREDPIVDSFDLSPDGRMVVYQARQLSGQYQIFVSEFPSGHGQWQVAEDAVQPRFSYDGREVFFLKKGTDSSASTTTMMSRTVNTKPTFELGAATSLFSGEGANLLDRQDYQVAPDGRRFITLKSLPPAPGEGKRFLWMQNWQAAIKR